jgi:hypothetical protein
MATDGGYGAPDEPALIARLARCAADLYRTVPREGAGLAAQAAEISHASDLDLLAASLDAGADVDLDHVLRPADIRAVCQLLLDVRRSPLDVSAAERDLARAHFPEVDAPSLEPLEALITYYTSLLHGD